MCRKKYGLIILSFLALAALTWTVPNASAEEPLQKIRFRDRMVEHFDGGITTETFGMQPYVLNGNNWVDRIISNNGTHFNVYSEMGSFSFSKNDCTITQYDSGFNPIEDTAHQSDIVIGDWFWTIARKNGANPWEVVDPLMFGCSINAFQNSTGKYLEMTRTHNPTGSYLKVTLAAPEGKPVEDFNEFYMNVPAWSGNKFAFVLWAKDVKADSLTYRNNTVVQIPQGQTIIDRSHLTVDSLNFIKDGNAFFFDWQKAVGKFKTLMLNKTGSNLDIQFGFNNNAGTLSSGQKMSLDPTYGFTTYTTKQNIQSGPPGGGANCVTGAQSFIAVGIQTQKVATTNAASEPCISMALQWDISSISDASTITNSSFRTVITSATNGINCDINQVTSDVATESAANLWTQTTTGTTYLNNNAWCASTGGRDVDLGSTADSYIQNTSLGLNRFAIGIFYDAIARDASDHNYIASLAELKITYMAKPNAITTLAVTDFGTDFADLSFSAPNMNGGTLQVYMFNYTTPCSSNPQTMLPNGTVATTYTISNLIPATCYTFRGTAATEGGTNVTGANEVNVTTLAFNEANFTIGSFNFNAQNPNIFPIRYERIDLNTTHTLVNITFNNAINLACDLEYTYAGINQTYHTIPSSAISASENEASFQFVNATNEITTFRCWNQAGNQSANFVLTQTDFLLLQQIDDFRNGTYGTMGQFGAFDLVSLFIVIISMVGLNHKSKSVAGFFCIVAISIMAFFEIILWQTAIVAGLAVIIMLAIAATRKD